MNFDPWQFAGVSNRGNLTTLLVSNEGLSQRLITSRRALVQESAGVGVRLRGSCSFLLPGMFSVSEANRCSVQVIHREKKKTIWLFLNVNFKNRNVDSRQI